MVDCLIFFYIFGRSIYSMKANTEIPESLRPFLFYGVNLNLINFRESQRGDCPLCMESDHFFVDRDSGKWHCKKCDESGNVPSFLPKFHEACLAATDESDYQELSKDRSLPTWALKKWGLAKNPLTDEWLIPAYNLENKLANLNKAVLMTELDEEGNEKEFWKVMGCPGCKVHPFGTNLLTKKQNNRFVAEGPWDGIAAYAMLATLKVKGEKLIKVADPKSSMLQDHGVFAVPGAGNFNAEWLAHLKGRNGFLCFDNDHPKRNKTNKIIQPGWQGMNRVCKLAGENGHTPNSLSKLLWGKKGYDKDLPSGYDLRDLLKDKGPIKAFNFILEKSEEVDLEKVESEESDVEKIEPVKRESFDDLLKDYEQVLLLNQDIKDALAVMLATVISTPLDGAELAQVWFRIIAPPGAAKTTLAEAVSAAKEFCVALSKFNGLHSGYRAFDKKKGKLKDTSLIGVIRNKCVFIKDADTLCSSGNLSSILAELRDIFDCSTKSMYLNEVKNEHDNVRSTFVLCGTHELRSTSRSFLGERFLDFEMHPDADSRPVVERATANMYSRMVGGLSPKENGEAIPKKGKSLILKQATYGYLQYLVKNLSDKAPRMDKHAEDQIYVLADLLSYLRARVKRERDDIMYRPFREQPTRIAAQLTRLSVCLAIVLGKPTVDSEVLRIIKKVFKDTAKGFHAEIVDLLLDKKLGMDIDQIARRLGISEAAVRRHIDDMRHFGIVKNVTRPNNSGVRGRHRHLWELTIKFKNLYKKAIR